MSITKGGEGHTVQVTGEVVTLKAQHNGCAFTVTTWSKSSLDQDPRSAYWDLEWDFLGINIRMINKRSLHPKYQVMRARCCRSCSGLTSVKRHSRPSWAGEKARSSIEGLSNFSNSRNLFLQMENKIWVSRLARLVLICNLSSDRNVWNVKNVVTVL